MITFNFKDHYIEHNDLGFSTTLVCLSNWQAELASNSDEDVNRRMGNALIGKIEANLVYIVPTSNCWYKNLDNISINTLSTELSGQKNLLLMEFLWALMERSNSHL
ncbi:hypothetical protein [Paraglaciecola sp.]|uniref:hypothetical protein n=1 Tax=Paraglaciecola sp. TaxID=1920173 RepID=UPI003265E0F3